LEKAKSVVEIYGTQGEMNKQMTTNCSDLTLRPPRKEKICVIIVTYFPDIDGFRSRLNSIRDQVPRIVIIDNTPDDSVQKNLQESDKIKVQYIHNTINLGLASAMNRGARWALENNYEWAIFFDQDTTVDPNIIASLLETYAMVDNPRVAVMGCNYYDPTVGKPTFKTKKDNAWEIRLEVITSGSLISLEAWERVKGFREIFFIDCVDTDFGLKCSRAGYLVIFSPKVLMTHKIGNTKFRRIFGFPWVRVLSSDHPPFRKYFRVRNQLIIWSEYFWPYPKWTIKDIMSFTFFMIKELLVDERWALQLRFIFLGIMDALSERMDRKIDPSGKLM